MMQQRNETKRPFWESLDARPLWRLALWVLLFGFAERLIVSLVLFYRWGWHTVSGIELWFYYGVAKGTFHLYSAFDPSWWMLKILGFLFSGEVLLYSVFFISSFCSAVNGALFCFLLGRLHDKKTGLLAGVLYTSMVLPMFNSAGTVTHDIFAEPYLILAVYGAAMAFRSKGWKILAYAALSAVSVYLGKNVGPSVFVAVGAIVIFLLWRGVLAFLGEDIRRRWIAFGIFSLGVLGLVALGSRLLFKVLHPHALIIAALALALYYILFQWIRVRRAAGRLPDFVPLAVFLAVVALLLVLLHLEVMPAFKEYTFDRALIERGVNVRDQIKAGSGDVLATSEGDYWLRFNFLIFFLPVGLFIAFKKRDVLVWGMVFSGFLAALAADRGTRPLSMGVAWAAALALANWSVAFDWAVAAALAFVAGYFGGRYSTEYAVIFPVGAVVMYLCVQWSRRGERARASLLPLSLGILWLVLGSILGVSVLKARQAGNAARFEAIRKYWTVQSCLLVPTLILLLEAFLRRPALNRKSKDPASPEALRWFGRETVRRYLFIGYGLLALALAATAIVYLGLLSGQTLEAVGSGFGGAVGFLWKNLYLYFPAAAGGLIFLFAYPRRREPVRPVYGGIAAACFLFATVIPSMNQTPKSSEAEYRIYRWLESNAPRTGKIMVPWSDGYLAESISGLPSIFSPHNIDFDIPRLYWQSEEEAAQALIANGVRYILISTKYFRLMAYNPSSGEFQYSFSPDIIYQPQQVGINKIAQLEKTALFQLLYKPQELKRFRLLRRELDTSEPDPKRREAFLAYEVK
jgi:hypothetical protein